jgi:hypothetical protein
MLDFLQIYCNINPFFVKLKYLNLSLRSQNKYG